VVERKSEKKKKGKKVVQKKRVKVPLKRDGHEVSFNDIENIM